MDVIFSLLGQIIAYGGGGAVIGFFLFKYLGQAWIENKFKERLEQARHEQALEIQRLRVEIDSLLSGAIKLQDRDFEVLPTAWAKLYEANAQIISLVSPMQQYADVDRMNDVQLDEFLEKTEFTPSQQDEVRKAHRKSDVYMDIVFWYKLHKAKVAFSDLQEYLARNGIFLDEEIKEKMEQICQTLWSAVVSKEVGYEAKDWKMQSEGWDKIKQETDPLFKEIEKYIQDKLQSHGKWPNRD